MAVGDVFEIGMPEYNRFRHIRFLRPNFIIKGGGIADYKRVAGTKVVVLSAKDKKDGTTLVQIKREGGGRFFGNQTKVLANFDKAVLSKELLTR